MRGNILQKGPKTGNGSAAIMIGEEGVTQPTLNLVVTANQFTNNAANKTVFVRNLSSASAILQENILNGPVSALVGKGSVE
jgi:hypothetical protein